VIKINGVVSAFINTFGPIGVAFATIGGSFWFIWKKTIMPTQQKYSQSLEKMLERSDEQFERHLNKLDTQEKTMVKMCNTLDKISINMRNNRELAEKEHTQIIRMAERCH